MNTVTPNQAFDLIQNQNAVLIDVRTAAEFKQQHIASAYSLPLDQLKQHIEQLTLNENQPVILQCQKGARGAMAYQMLSDSGLQLHNMTGGLDAWVSAELPTIGGNETTKIPMPRQVQMTSGLFVLLLASTALTDITWPIILLAVMGAMMIFSGASGWCGMATLLMKMPWNK